MNADPADQRLLLDLADTDRRLSRADALRRNPPQAARVQELIALRNEQGRELVVRTGARDDVRAEAARLETDVRLAEERRARDAQRLRDSDNVKQAQSLENEIASLGRRLSDLEDAQLEAMERLEAADAAVADQEAVLRETTGEGQRLSAEAKAVVEDAARDHAALTRDRAAVAGRIPADLLADYERLARRGTPAGLLTRGACGACNVVLSPSDLQALRATPADEVAHCPECGAILVRTEESGL